MKEMECPLCGALVEVPNGTGLFELLDCPNCEAELEYSKSGLIDVDDDF